MSDNNSGRDAVVTTGGWFLFMILLAIPVVNIIVILVEAFGSGSNRNKQGYCRALLIWFLLYVIGCILVYALCWGVLKTAAENFDVNIGSDHNVTEFLNQLDKKDGKTIVIEGDNSKLKVRHEANREEQAE